MEILKYLFIAMSVVAFTKAFMVARGIKSWKIKNETINSWISLCFISNAMFVLFLGEQNYLLIFPALNFMLLFAFYLQPTFRISKYLAYIFFPANILLIALLSLK